MFLQRRTADPRFLLFLVTVVRFMSSCKGTTPPPPLDVTGTWSGSASQTVAANTVADVMVLQLTQNGQAVSGTYVSNASGTVSGSVSGNTLTGTATASYGSCSLTVAVVAGVSESSMTGTYSGTDSCAGLITNGQFSLTKQTGQAVDVSGGWNGLGGEGGTGRALVFQLNQNSQVVAGTFIATDTATGIAISGTVTGAASGGALIGTLAGGYGTCNVRVTFAALVAVWSSTPGGMTGTYGGTNSCTGPVTNGQFTLVANSIFQASAANAALKDLQDLQTAFTNMLNCEGAHGLDPTTCNNVPSQATIDSNRTILQGYQSQLGSFTRTLMSLINQFNAAASESQRSILVYQINEMLSHAQPILDDIAPRDVQIRSWTDQLKSRLAICLIPGQAYNCN
jgi:hypothetical protein